jgi:hypothetical protein
MTLPRSFADTRFRRLFTVLLVALAACGDDSTGVENVASIRISPENPTTDVGLTVQFTAEALDANGTVLPNVAIVWASSDLDVATITDGGLATALTVGTTAITASAGSATPASEVLVVEPDQCTGRVDVVLEPGEHQAYPGSTCLLVPSGTSGDRYRIAITRPKLVQDPQDVPDVTLRVDPILTAEQAAGIVPIAPAGFVPSPTAALAGAGPASRVGGLDGSPFLRDRRILEDTRRFHEELRRREAEVGLRSQGLMPSAPARSSGPLLVDPPPRDDLFLVLECSASAARSPVVLVNFNDHVAVYQDSVENASNPLSPASTTLMLDYWADHVQQLIEEYWGPTPDIDGNDRVLLTTSNALPDSAAAGVFSGDFRSTADCASSNEGEIMYFAADVIRAMDDADPSYLALSVMAHEVKHVTSLFHAVARERIYGPGQGFHDIWIEEGTAEVSQTMSSRVAWASIGGTPVGERVTGSAIVSTVQANGGDVPPELWGVISEIADVIVQLSSQPNSLITNPAGAPDFHTFYAGGWHWHRFIGDAYGNASTAFGDGPLFTEMTDSLTLRGVQALQAVTGRSFDQLFEDLIVGMSLHDTGPEPARAFTTWDLTSTTAIFSAPPEVSPPGSYPWAVTTNSSSGTAARSLSQSAVYSCPPQLVGDRYVEPTPGQRCPMGPSGIRFHEFVSSGTGAGAQMRATGVPDGVITVVRIN